MTDYEARIGDEPVAPASGWRLLGIEMLTGSEPAAGIARLSDGTSALTAVIEGTGTDWVVTLRGRRIPVTVRSWRERTLAEAESTARTGDGPTDVAATLPGLVVAVEVVEGAEVVENQPLLTLEAMKMQNEVRAPRAGRIVRVAVDPGQAVSTGQLLIRLE